LAATYNYEYLLRFQTLQHSDERINAGIKTGLDQQIIPAKQLEKIAGK